MIRSGNVVEKNVFAISLEPVVCAAATATDVFPDETKVGIEIVYREIFNAGANNAFYKIGGDCDNVKNYNAYLVPGQMLEIASLQRVSVYSVAGTTISRTEFKRDDMVQPGKNIL